MWGRCYNQKMPRRASSPASLPDAGAGGTALAGGSLPAYGSRYRRWKGAWRRLRRRQSNRKAVQELSRSLALIVDREALESSVSARIRELFDPDRILFLQPDPAGGDFVPGSASGLPATALSTLKLARSGRLVRWLLVNESVLNTEREKGVYEYLGAAEQRMLQQLRVTLCVPLICLNRLTGILMLGWDHRDWALGSAELELLHIVASQASLAFENAAAYREQGERLERLHRAERLAAVGQLAAGVAHEIRNPLTAIRSTLQYLTQGLASSEAKKELVEELLDEVDRINSTISSLLSLTRGGELNPEPLDLVDPLEAALRLLRVQASHQGVEVTTELAEGGFPVVGDKGQLKQVFLNLLMNALQAMPDGGRLAITASAWSPPAGPGEGRWVEVRMADTGRGISPEELGKVFDPFYTNKREGTGLGLSICHGIVQQHRGSIQVESRHGQGTTVTLRFPLTEESRGEDSDH